MEIKNGDLLDDVVLRYSTVSQHMMAHPGAPHHGRDISVTPQDRKEKKRKADAKYRQSRKMRKEELGINLQNFRETNDQLKRENESCQKENDSMVKKLRSKEVDIADLKNNICNSTEVISNQENLLKTLSQPFVEQLMLGSNKLEVELLDNERDILSQNAGWDDWESEKIQLLDEIMKLGHRNVMLKMQNQALVDKILNKKGYGSKHEKDFVRQFLSKGTTSC